MIFLVEFQIFCPLLIKTQQLLLSLSNPILLTIPLLGSLSEAPFSQLISAVILSVDLEVKNSKVQDLQHPILEEHSV